MKPELRAGVVEVLKRDRAMLKRQLGGDITPARRSQLLEALAYVRLSLEQLNVYEDEEEEDTKKRRSK